MKLTFVAGPGHSRILLTGCDLMDIQFSGVLYLFYCETTFHFLECGFVCS
jgi:hypothetical protein